MENNKGWPALCYLAQTETAGPEDVKYVIARQEALEGRGRELNCRDTGCITAGQAIAELLRVRLEKRWHPGAPPLPPECYGGEIVPFES